MNSKPTVIRLSNIAADELHRTEYASYEDHKNALPNKETKVPGRYGDTHVCDIILRSPRYKADTRMTLTDSEAAEMYYALCSGTFQLEEKGYLATARRLADRLRDAARRHDAELVTRWPAPSGY